MRDKLPLKEAIKGAQVGAHAMADAFRAWKSTTNEGVKLESGIEYMYAQVMFRYSLEDCLYYKYKNDNLPATVQQNFNKLIRSVYYIDKVKEKDLENLEAWVDI